MYIYPVAVVPVAAGVGCAAGCVLCRATLACFLSSFFFCAVESESSESVWYSIQLGAFQGAAAAAPAAKSA